MRNLGLKRNFKLLLFKPYNKVQTPIQQKLLKFCYLLQPLVTETAQNSTTVRYNAAFNLSGIRFVQVLSGLLLGLGEKRG